MISKNLNFNFSGSLRLTGIAVAIAAILCGAAYLSAFQPETPIVISDGSLTMRSSVAWTAFAGPADSPVHPSVDKTVASVRVQGAGFPAGPIPFSGQKVEVVVIYANTTTIDVVTGPNGKRLTVHYPSGLFHQGANDHEKAHNNPNGSITHVTVRRNDAVVPGFDNNASPHTTVTVQYDR